MLSKGNHQKSLSCPFRYGWLPLRLERLWLSLSWLDHVFQPDINSWSMFSYIWSWDLTMTALMHSHTWDVLHTVFILPERMITENRTILILLLPSVMFTICVFIGVCACVCVQHPHSLQATQQVGQYQLGWASSRQLGWFLCLPCGPASLRACLCSLDSWASSRQLGLFESDSVVFIAYVILGEGGTWWNWSVLGRSWCYLEFFCCCCSVLVTCPFRKVLYLPLEHPVVLPACKDCLKISCMSHCFQHLHPKGFPSMIEGFNLVGNWYTTSSLICLPRGKHEKRTKDMCKRGK